MDTFHCAGVEKKRIAADRLLVRSDSGPPLPNSNDDHSLNTGESMITTEGLEQPDSMAGNSCTSSNDCDNEINVMSKDDQHSCEAEGAVGYNDGLHNALLLCRDDVLLLDPETDLVALEEDACMTKNNDFVASVKIPGTDSMLDMNEKSAASEDKLENRFVELIDECEHVLDLCSGNLGTNDNSQLKKMNNMLTTILSKIQDNAHLISSDADSTSDVKEDTSMEDTEQCASCDMLETDDSLHGGAKPKLPREAWAENSEPPASTNMHSVSDIDSDMNTSGPGHFDSLPCELHHKILSYLTIQELCSFVVPVCKQWQQLAYDPIHWQNLNLTGKDSISEDQLCAIIKRAPLLLVLSMPGMSHLSRTIHNISTYCIKLKSLNIGFIQNIEEDYINDIADSCSDLEDLNLEGASFIDDVASITRAICHIQKLHSLNLSHCTIFDDDAVIMLSQNLPYLTDINIDGISWISDVAIEELASTHRDRLTSVVLDGAELTDVSIQRLSTCPKIHTLKLSFCEQLTDNALTYIKNMSCLRTLKLKKGLDLTGEMLKNLFDEDSLSQLEHLDLSECIGLQDDGVMKLSQCCSKLIELELGWCWNISDHGISAITNNCRNLEKLSLIGLKIITGVDLQKVPENMCGLVDLDLTQCNNIDDNLVKQVAAVMPKLRVLDYYGNGILDDDSYLD